MIKYALYENNLTDDPNDYYAVVKADKTANLEDLVQDIIDFGTTLNEPEIREVIKQYQRAILKRLQNNERVLIEDLLELYVTITGVFNGQGDGFDASRHQINAGANVLRAMEKQIQTVEVQKIESDKPAPAIISFLDKATGNPFGVITPGGMAVVRGHRMKFDTEQEDEGIFFVSASGHAATQVPSASIGVNRPSELLFVIPALSAGDYYLEVRARLQGVNDVRAGRFDKTLTIPV